MGDVDHSISSVDEPFKSSTATTTVEASSFSSSATVNHRPNLLQLFTDAKCDLEGKDNSSSESACRSTPKQKLRAQISSVILEVDALCKKGLVRMKRKGCYSSSNTTTPSNSNDGSGSGTVSSFAGIEEVDRRESADSDDLFDLCMAFDNIKCNDGGDEEEEDGRCVVRRSSSEKNKSAPLEGAVDDMPGSASPLRIFGDFLNIDDGGEMENKEEIGIDIEAGSEEEDGVENEETPQVLSIPDTHNSALPSATVIRAAGGNLNGRTNNNGELQLLHSTFQIRLRLLQLGTAYIKAKRACAALQMRRKAKAKVINKVLKKVVLWLDRKGEGKDKEEELWKRKILMGQRCKPSEALGSLWEEEVEDCGTRDRSDCPCEIEMNGVPNQEYAS